MQERPWARWDLPQDPFAPKGAPAIGAFRVRGQTRSRPRALLRLRSAGPHAHPLLTWRAPRCTSATGSMFSKAHSSFRPYSITARA
jgi:hypothetical protein